jgi:hypothetical protein
VETKETRRSRRGGQGRRREEALAGNAWVEVQGIGRATVEPGAVGVT